MFKNIKRIAYYGFRAPILGAFFAPSFPFYGESSLKISGSSFSPIAPISPTVYKLGEAINIKELLAKVAPELFLFTKKQNDFHVFYTLNCDFLGTVEIEYNSLARVLAIKGDICESELKQYKDSFDPFRKLTIKVRDWLEHIKPEVKELLRLMQTLDPKLKDAINDLYANHLYFTEPEASLHTLSTKNGDIKCAFVSFKGDRGARYTIEIQSLDCAVQYMQWRAEYIFQYEWNLGREECVGQKHSWLFIFNSEDIASNLISKLEKSFIVKEFIIKHKLKTEDVFSKEGVSIHIKRFPGTMEIFRIMAESPDIFPREILQLFIDKTNIDITLPPETLGEKLSSWINKVKSASAKGMNGKEF